MVNLSVLLYLTVVPCLISAQSEGDVRLAGGSKKNVGRLEIFWHTQWSTFCGLSRGGAQAACRQLGYLNFIGYKPLDKVNPNANITKASSDTPIAIDHTDCSVEDDLHILRCGYSTDLAPDCNHSNDIVLQCETISLWQHPYQTQVRLNHTLYPSSGVLEIYVGHEWGNVCGSEFSQVAADTTCRQMGYTGASSFSRSSPPSTAITWLDDVSCGSTETSCDCLNGCFGNVPSQPVSCANNHYVNVTCEYDVNIAQSVPPGSEDRCLDKASCDGRGNGAGLTSSSIAGIAMGVVLLVAIVCATFVAVFWVVLRKRRGQYSVIDGYSY